MSAHESINLLTGEVDTHQCAELCELGLVKAPAVVLLEFRLGRANDEECCRKIADLL